jgi:hypothetical protein
VPLSLLLTSVLPDPTLHGVVVPPREDGEGRDH